MSVGIHVGQCGNQVGAAYWRLAGAAGGVDADDREDAGPSAPASNTRIPPRKPTQSSASASASASTDHGRTHLFHPRSGHARCILVDAEPKAVRASVRSCGPAFRPAHVLTEHRGRGNNWAMGYYFAERTSPVTGAQRTLYPFNTRNPDEGDGGHLADRVLESLRREIESLDGYRGSLVTLSLGGGTGSGVGSRVLERVRDAYPRAYLVAAAVAPSVSAGDSPLQNYNAVLTLQALRKHADGIIYRDNDELLRTVRYWRALVGRGYDAGYAGSTSTSTSFSSSTPLRPASSGGAASSDNTRVTLMDMNDVLAADLAGLTFPTTSSSASSSVLHSWRPFDVGKFVHDLCPMPDARFVDVRSGVLRWRPRRSDRKANTADRLVFHAMTAPLSMTSSLSGGGANSGDGNLAALEAVAKATAQSFPRANYSAIASTAIVRGFTPAQGSNEVATRWLDTSLPRLEWPTSPSTVVNSSASPFFSPSNSKAQQPTASVTMCGNNGHFIPTTRVFLDRARRQFSARAYLHWYQQHGLPMDGEHDTFREAFSACDTLISNYETLLADR